MSESAPPSPARTSAGVTFSERQIKQVIIGVMAGMAVAALDGTIVNTALPTIVVDLGGLKYYAWVGTAYMLTSTASTPLFGKISDLYGRRRPFQAAIALFVLGSLFCGIAQNMPQLVLARGLQGIGGGGIFALSFAIVGDVVAPRDRGRYIGMLTSVFTVASVVGPLLGGFIVDHSSWRWIFLINLPIGAIALSITDRSLRFPFQVRPHSIDWQGATLLVCGVTSLLLGLSWTGEEYGWGHASTLGLFALSVVLTAAFVWWEKRADEPIVPMTLLNIDVVRVIMPFMFLVGAAFFGTNAFLPLYLQGVTGVSATNSGLLLAPVAIATAIAATSAGRYTARTGSYKHIAPYGTVIGVIGLCMLALLKSSSGYLALAIAGSFLVGFAIGLVMPVATTATQNSVDITQMGAASSVLVFVRQLGGAVGLAAFGAAFNASLSDRIDPGLVQAPRMIKKLPEPQRTEALTALTNALTVVFKISIPVLVIALFCAVRIPIRPLRSTNNPAPADAAGAMH